MSRSSASGRSTDRTPIPRRRRFVGRDNERAIFQDALAAKELPFQVLHIYGPGGIGKTSLLNEFVALAQNQHAAPVYLDARNLDPTPAAFINTLQQALGLASTDDLFKTLAGKSTRSVILIDTYEALAPLDAWLSQTLWNELPENAMVVLAGRNPPSATWRGESGWESFLRVVPLRNLSPVESHFYLTQRKIPAEQQPAVLEFTHGHPLALSLVADVITQRPGSLFEPETSPDIIKILIERFVQKVPGPAHRAALEACALVRVMTESLLAHILQPAGAKTLSAESAHELFEWLRGLSFVESGREGVFPHDLARDALMADLRWRNPDWHKELHQRAREYYLAHLQSPSGVDQQRILFDYIFLHRDNAAVRPMLEWQASGGILPDSIRGNDRDALIAMVSRHEGDESAKIAAHWLARQPESVTLYRDETGKPIGFIMILGLERATPENLQADPAARVAWDFLQKRAPLRKGEIAAYYRFWMAHDTYQSVSAVQTLVFLNTVRYQLTTPGLAFHFLPCADPDFWAPAFAYANLSRVTEIDYEIGGKRYGVYTHDWRAQPPMAWLAMLAEREVANAPVAAPLSTPLIVLSETEFADAVRDALRDFTNPDLLQKNPLTQSRVVAQKAGIGANAGERALALQSILKQAVDSLQSSPKQNKLYRALHHTYVSPAPTQEAAAETIDVPFSTYRRHLKAGLEFVFNSLWQQEIGR
jgi:hypothetical protein